MPSPPEDKFLGLPDVYIPKSPAKRGTSEHLFWAKEQFIRLVSHGYNFTQAAERLGYGYTWWGVNRKRDPEFEALVLAAASQSHREWTYPDISQMSFFDFCLNYGNFTLAEHQRRIEDALMDPLAKTVLILGHPESGKSTLVSLWYVLYKIAQNPDVRIALVTKNSTKAQDLLVRVQRYLTEEALYDDAPSNLIKDFNGFKPAYSQGMEWSQDQFFIKHRTSGERDPTVQALGIGKQIYGARLDLLILDDALVMDNQVSPTTRERLDNWFDGEARSRAQRGQTIVNGTRLLPFDLYGQWRKSWKGEKLFRYVEIPAILDEYTDNERPSWPEYWTLDGYEIKQEVNGEEHVVGYQQGLRDLRSMIVAKDPNRWRLIYQQQDVEEDSNIFTNAHIQAALELGAERPMGVVYDHERLILGVDPATTGRAAAVLIAVDPSTRVRTVVDIFVGANLGATGVRSDLMYHFWEKYKDHRVDVTVIETNLVKTLMGDEGFMARATALGTDIRQHHTHARGPQGKWDQEFGIAAMASLFGSGLFAFANAGADDRSRLEPLIEDLLVFPFADQQDAVIGLWLANSHANNVYNPLPSQESILRRRGVPDVVANRRRMR